MRIDKDIVSAALDVLHKGSKRSSFLALQRRGSVEIARIRIALVLIGEAAVHVDAVIGAEGSVPVHPGRRAAALSIAGRSEIQPVGIQAAQNIHRPVIRFYQIIIAHQPVAHLICQIDQLRAVPVEVILPAVERKGQNHDVFPISDLAGIQRIPA